MDLGDVRTFLEVADAGGVSPAARRLGLSKSIVSRRLARGKPIESDQVEGVLAEVDTDCGDRGGGGSE